ncbi:lysis protein [Serratia proteamaculans]|uniref:lysis protein n=1 Tax=Serratia proteamaculans TaxID=28151 RepID=UPI00217915B9|nr:lysis protein [Serratia proteamaculans]CAI0987113.1 Bacteriophage lysis protein [Serratia proteamaculans]
MMLAHWRGMAIGLLLAVLAGKAWWFACQVDALSQENSTLSQQVQADNTKLKQQRSAIAANAAIDKQYTEELARAESEINHLRVDVESGRRRLHIAATCTQRDTSTSGVDDASRPRLTDAAQRDYFTLRERIALVGKQIAGLQAYISRVCQVGE